jgi:diguanylate cyclase (GGDEF)-like protein/PAS domain S-box-containing protein
MILQLLRSGLRRLLGRARGEGNPAAPAIDFRALTEGSLDVICVVKLANHVPHFSYVSPAAFEVLGWSAEEVMMTPMREIFTAESLAKVGADIDRLYSGQETSLVEVEVIRKDGRHVWVENKVSVLKKEYLGDLTVMVCMRDITQRKLLQDQLAQMALLDGLTGIGNRRAFDQTLETETRRAARMGIPLSLLLLDVDHFKLLNDKYGHRVGDDCLRAIAESLRDALKRAGDSVTRYGGEEFAVLLPDTPLDGAEEVARQLCHTVANLRIPHRGNPTAGSIVTVSCGVSTAVALTEETEAVREGLLLAADAALYRAKSEGRNRVVTAPSFGSPTANIDPGLKIQT